MVSISFASWLAGSPERASNDDITERNHDDAGQGQPGEREAGAQQRPEQRFEEPRNGDRKMDHARGLRYDRCQPTALLTGRTTKGRAGAFGLRGVKR